jgi:class 3 adenylate cyclase
LVCVFGVGSDEPGTQQAIQTALILQDWVGANKSLLGARIGIATGTVALHSVSKTRADISGKCAEIASRLERIAKPGEILVEKSSAIQTTRSSHQIDHAFFRDRMYEFVRIR